MNDQELKRELFGLLGMIEKFSYIGKQEKVEVIESYEDYMKMIYRISGLNSGMSKNGEWVLPRSISYEEDPIGVLLKHFTLPEFAMMVSGYLFSNMVKAKVLDMGKYLFEELDGLDRIVSYMKPEDREYYRGLRSRFVGEVWKQIDGALDRKEESENDLEDSWNIVSAFSRKFLKSDEERVKDLAIRFRIYVAETFAWLIHNANLISQSEFELACFQSYIEYSVELSSAIDLS